MKVAKSHLFPKGYQSNVIRLNQLVYFYEVKTNQSNKCYKEKSEAMMSTMDAFRRHG
jgi:hypothetical protein